MVFHTIKSSIQMLSSFHLLKVVIYHKSSSKFHVAVIEEQQIIQLIWNADIIYSINLLWKLSFSCSLLAFMLHPNRQITLSIVCIACVLCSFYFVRSLLLAIVCCYLKVKARRANSIVLCNRRYLIHVCLYFKIVFVYLRYCGSIWIDMMSEYESVANVRGI